MSSQHIASIVVKTVLVPITPAHRTASGVVEKSPLVLVDIHCTGGLTGHAILFTYTPIALKPVADLVLGFGDMLVGQPLNPRALNQLLLQRTRLIGSQGLVGMAIAGIDMALWDAMARHHCLPLCQLLGGEIRPVKAYGGTGYDGELETARQAENWAKRGYSGVKAKIGYPTVEQDIKVVRAMRAAVGPDIDVMVDYNQSLSPTDAIQRLSALDDEGLLWIEEPVLAHDYINTAKVKDAIHTPVQSGENWWGPADMQLALQADASDFVMPDVMKIGGVTGWMSAVSLAEAAGKQVSSHLWPEVSAHLLAIGQTSHRLEYVDWWNEILQEPLLIEKGLSVIDPDSYGSGIHWNTTKVAQYSV
ncbi:MAG: enolase C-terminal domain-like protein [Granulosicoccus sp.]